MTNAQFIRPFDLGAATFGHIPAIVNSTGSGQNRQIAGKNASDTTPFKSLIVCRAL
ncbi:hypothetical protein IFT62_23800 [Pseudomonas lutea]|jgi:hypothetical protein|uniref:Uncharacterized protein n=1 Tax=Pseudomonas lutea TaxID=243924 RepID=A0ABR9AEN1_9PSED|nr:hypothetical protein [Pseudomonas lutea]MBD8124232.1 hypothetical protein [Pseudomonas lutea]